MKCIKCGVDLADDSKFCGNCGATIDTQVVSNNNGGSSVDTPVMIDVKPVSPSEVNSSVGGSAPSMSEPIMTSSSSVNSEPTMSGDSSLGMNNNVSNLELNGNVNGNGQGQVQKKGIDFKYVAIGLGAVVVVLVAVLVMGTFNKDNDSMDGNNGGSTGDNAVVTPASKSSYKVNFNGFTFSIPDNLIYQENDGSLLIGDEADTWIASIEVVEGSYSQLQVNKGQLQGNMQRNGYTASVADEKKLGGVDFITLELSKGGQNFIAALTRANSMYYFGVTAVDIDNEFNYDILKNISSILSTAEFSDSKTVNMKEFQKIDMTGVEELAK